MSKKKKPSNGRKCLPRKKRLVSARAWIAKYKGKNIVRGYRKHYGVDYMCAIKELQMLGVTISQDYIDNIERVLKDRHMEKERKKKEELRERYRDSNEKFAYIVGYTSWGFPYGVTWEEMGEEPPDFGELWSD